MTGVILRTLNAGNFKIDEMSNMRLSSKTTYDARSFDTSRVTPVNLVVGQSTIAQFEMTLSSFPVENGIYAEILFPT